MATDLEQAVQALKAKNRPLTKLWQYYDGDQPLRYSTQRLQSVFNMIDVRFCMNWCEVVVNAVLDKLVLKRFVVSGNKGLTQKLNDLWLATEMKLSDDDVHLAMLVTGEAFVIVWDDLVVGLEAYYNDPLLCHLFYEPDHPIVKRLGTKWWAGDDGYMYLNLYYADKIEYYKTRSQTERVEEAKAFVLQDTAKHNFGEVPIYHFRRERRAIKSELSSSVLSLQDAVNKLLADMMVSAEFAAFRQRYIISNMDVKGQLKNAPNEIWNIPGGDGYGQGTSVGEFSATDLANFMAPIEKLATAVALITRTPRHYFFEKAGSNPSGEALMALEAALNAKAERYVERLQADWGRVAQALLRLEGAEVDRRKISTVFKDPRTLQPMTQAQARQTNVNAGVPLATVLRREGWSEEDIAQMAADKQEEQAAAQSSLASALLEQQRRFDQEQGQGGAEGQRSKGDD